MINKIIKQVLIIKFCLRQRMVWLSRNLKLITIDLQNIEMTQDIQVGCYERSDSNVNITQSSIYDHGLQAFYSKIENRCKVTRILFTIFWLFL
jgi:hypothetical protein